LLRENAEVSPRFIAGE
jgi:hypothetical protein